MEVDITYGNITVRLGGVASYCHHGDGATVQPDNPSGVTVISYTYAVAGTGYQVTNPTGQIPTDQGGDPRILSTVAPGTVIPATHSLVCLFTRATRPPGWLSSRSSYIDEALPIVVVSYGPLNTSLAPVLMRPPAIGHPSNATILALRSTPLIFDNPTIGNLPSVIDIDALPVQPSPGWGGFFNERPDIDDYIAAVAGFCGELWTGWATEGYVPFLQTLGGGYGGFYSAWVSHALLMAVSTDNATKRRTLAQRLTQWGLDILGSFIHGRQDYADGGHMQGRKALVVFSGHMLQAPWKDAKAFLTSIGSTGIFNEDRQFYTASPAWVWGWPYGYQGKTDIPCNMEAPIASWNASCVYYLPQYFAQEVCGTQIGCAVAMRILGISDEMGVAHRGMMEQWVEGPTPENEALMAARAPALGSIDWGGSYGANTGTQDFGRAAWEVYGEYDPDPPDPVAEPNIGVTGNGNAITNNDDTPSATDHTSFGTATEGGSTISRTFTVSNSGDKDLAISAVTVPNGYTITTALPSTIAVAANAPLVIRLNTATPGTKYGPVSIVSDDPDASKFEFFITGTVNAAGGGPAPTPNVVVNAATVLAAQAYFRRR